MNVYLTEVERDCFKEIQLEIKKLNGAKNAKLLPVDMQQFLKEKAKAWRTEKHTGPRATTHAVVQDMCLTLDCVSDELVALNAHTDVQSFLFSVKGKIKHTSEAFIWCSEKANHYLLHGVKKDASDIAKEFEAYVLADIEGVILNHNGQLAELKGKICGAIREGLVAITRDAKAAMHYDKYEKLIVVEKGSLQSLHHLLTALKHDDAERQCCWVTLAKKDWEKQIAAYEEAQVAAGPQKQKHKACMPLESDGNSNDGELSGVQVRPAKKSKKMMMGGKENEGAGAGTGKGKTQGGLKPKSANTQKN
ncbi:hypothetical protein K439DRAFT_1622256 [Ramaria rubella]|nr:hypothetical protein K439DRAFT_1622256 [Ramaria rubella]